HRLVKLIGDGEVGPAVAVEVRRGNAGGGGAGGEGLLGGESGRPRPRHRRVQQYRHHLVRLLGGGEVGPAVAVDVRRRHPEGGGAGGEGLLGGEGGRPRPGRRRVQEHRHRLVCIVRDDEVGPAVPVDVRCGHVAGAAAG